MVINEQRDVNASVTECTIIDQLSLEPDLVPLQYVNVAIDELNTGESDVRQVSFTNSRFHIFTTDQILWNANGVQLPHGFIVCRLV